MILHINTTVRVYSTSLLSTTDLHDEQKNLILIETVSTLANIWFVVYTVHIYTNKDISHLYFRSRTVAAKNDQPDECHDCYPPTTLRIMCSSITLHTAIYRHLPSSLYFWYTAAGAA
jgi:hypothetical protein